MFNTAINNKTALICGVSGQDGAYLANFLLNKGYVVFGASRDATVNSFVNLKALGVYEKVNKISMNLSDFRSVLSTLTTVNPSEIYNLSGQSSVGLSFEQPVETFESISIATLNLLEAVRFFNLDIKVFNACSGECFGDMVDNYKSDEKSVFKPKSPYGIAKATSFWQVQSYRECYSMYICSGILFNHESPLRPNRFVIPKITQAAIDIKNRKENKIILGDLSISRDWGWANEYVEAMWKMLQISEPIDLIISTGESNTLKSFAEVIFNELDLDLNKYLVIDESLYRPNEIISSAGNPAKAESTINWRANLKMKDIASLMVRERMTY